MQFNQLIDRFKISKALVDLARAHLLAKGVSPTQARIAEELNVEQSMISQIEASKKSFSKEKIELYAEHLGKTFSDLVCELVAMVPAEEPPQPANTIETKIVMIADRVDELINQTTLAIELLQKMIFQPKIAGECAAMKFYEKIVRCAFNAFRSTEFPIVCAAIVFRHGLNDRLMVVNDAFNRRAFNLNCCIPRNLADAIEKRVLVRAESLVEEWSIIRPAAEFSGELDADAHYWEKFTGESAREAGTRLKVFAIGVQRNVAQDEHAHTVSLLFTFRNSMEGNDKIKLAMWLFGQAVQQIHAIELRDNARSIARVVGLSLLPADIRPHDAFYPHAGTACSEKLEAVVSAFFKRISHDLEIGPLLATADIWSYDWTKGKFACLSQYFRMIKRGPGKKELTYSDGSKITLAEAYERAFESLTPRPYGKTAFILTTRRALIVDRPAPFGSTSSPTHPELDIGTFLGVPIALYDRDNDRHIYSVLYVRCVKQISSAKQLVLRISEIAQEFVPELCVTLAPPMTRGVASKIRAESHKLIEEPGEVRIISAARSRQDKGVAVLD